MHSDSRQIVIASGYPKSGNTWLTRLTAQLIGCPVKGFWTQPDNNDIAIEGKERKSEYRCFKAHHTFPILTKSFTDYGNGTEKVIYIVRDPRDVAISASFFFKRLRGKRIFRLLGLSWLHNKITLQAKLTEYCKIVANGGDLPWMNISWADHVESYLDSGALIIKYENLNSEPALECQRILNFLGIHRSERDIERAIYLQSFEKKKNELIKRKNYQKAVFLRTGKSEQWRDIFSEKQNKIIVSACADMMQKFEYV